MKSKTQSHKAPGPLTEFNDYELKATLHDFLEEEEKEKSSVWNIATIAGLAMFLVSMLYVLQLLGLLTGLSGWMNVLPIIGAVLIVFIGFGFFVGDRKRVKRTLKKQRRKRKEYFDAEFGSSSSDAKKEFSFDKHFFNKTKSSTSKENNPFSADEFDRYALGQSKKLYKSRTDKKVAGVCGGLAKYFGINANIIRFLFLVTIFAGIGSPVIIYIIFAIILDKEPPELMVADDLKY